MNVNDFINKVCWQVCSLEFDRGTLDWERSGGNDERVVVDDGGRDENKKVRLNHFC
jgi:hypothetical protein